MYIYIYDYSKRLESEKDGVSSYFQVEFSRKLDKLEGERGPGF